MHTLCGYPCTTGSGETTRTSCRRQAFTVLRWRNATVGGNTYGGVWTALARPEWRTVDEPTPGRCVVGGRRFFAIATTLTTSERARRLTRRREHRDDGPWPMLSARSLKVRLMLADIAAVLVGALVATVLQWLFLPVPKFIVQTHMLLLLLSLPLFIWGALCRTSTRPEPTNARRRSGATSSRRSASSSAAWCCWRSSSSTKALSRFWVIALAAATTVALIVEREIARRIFTRLRQQGKLRRPIVIVGTDAHAVRLMHTFQRRPDLGYEVLGFVGPDDIGERGGVKVLGTIDEIERILDERRQRRGGVALVGARPGHERPGPEAHRPRLPRRPLVQLARHRHEPAAPPAVRRLRDALHRAGHPPRMAPRREAGVRRDGRLLRPRAHPARAPGGDDRDPPRRAQGLCSSARSGSDATVSRSR